MGYDSAATSAAMRAIVEEVSAQFFERSGVVRALVIAMLAGEHSLILGPPGTGKSKLVMALTARVTGCRNWKIQLGRFTDPKKIFGPLDVGALMKGVYTQMFEGRATTAHVAFVDEIFKCSDATLNEMLSWFNERMYFPEAGGDAIECPLISAVCASNELPSGEELAALYDRLLVRLLVDYIADPANFAALIRSAVKPGTPAVEPTTVDLGALQTAVEEWVPAVDVPDDVVQAMVLLKISLRQASLEPSDRRFYQSVRLLQASAFLEGRSAVSLDDMLILSHVLWDSPADRGQVERLVLQQAFPMMAEALDELDALNEIDQQLTALIAAGTSKTELREWANREADGKLANSSKRLEKLIEKAVSEGRPTGRLQEAYERYEAVYTRVMVEALNVKAHILAGRVKKP